LSKLTSLFPTVLLEFTRIGTLTLTEFKEVAFFGTIIEIRLIRSTRNFPVAREKLDTFRDTDRLFELTIALEMLLARRWSFFEAGDDVFTL